ncbi:MAG: hypothetical protein DME33_04750 [Verrucomicrobia bacterium]|nr:MAG: hypothetical protein DME33_04750 [Verrucomicrobiota bacterium]
MIPESFRGWFLGASTEWPGVEPADVEIGDVKALAARYPDAAEDLRALEQRTDDSRQSFRSQDISDPARA